MSEQVECSSILGHKYEARYDERPRDLEGEFERVSAMAMRAMLFYKVYVRDVCVRCGHTIERRTHV